ncbi:lysozyme inhibitor LprI family protein [Clostridium tertium]|uniref:lysozyme inhibitor LprI family protein n=1 Tax=Clostridium tertium TaxID=1559 RepID=UPI000C081910|nr:lysozyme inhibitor LprI family protein [Clostridium tertium]
MKAKNILFFIIITLSLITLVSCSKDSKKSESSINKIEEKNQQIKPDVNDVNNEDNITATDSSSLPNKENINYNTQESNPRNPVTKIEGRRKEFIEKLDNIQKELDSLPEKKDSDAGITNAMRSFYGISYDMYDKALNEIYALLKEQLSPETMQNLQSEQIKWIEKKEATATNEAEKYKGGSFEFVAYNSSLYGTTKNRCYELVNNYMTD